MSSYQGVRNVRFSINLACFAFLLPVLRFTLLPYYQQCCQKWCLKLIRVGSKIISVNNLVLAASDEVKKIAWKSYHESIGASETRDRCILMRCSLVQSHDVELQMSFLPWDSYRKNITLKRKNLYSEFVDLEKAFDSVPGDTVWWTLRKVSAEGWLVMYFSYIYFTKRKHIKNYEKCFSFHLKRSFSSQDIQTFTQIYKKKMSIYMRFL